MPAATIARNAPPSPANPPEIMTAMYFSRYTGTPRVSAAVGFSPHIRSRSPNGVRHST